MVVNEENKLILYNIDELQSFNFSECGWCWVDFNSPTKEEVNLLESYFHFHHLAVEDCRHSLQRPKMDHYDNMHFLVLHTLSNDNNYTEEVNLFIRENLLVTFHQRGSIEVDAAWNKLLQRSELRLRGYLYAVYIVIDKLVDQYFPCLISISEQLEELDVWQQKNSMKNMIEKLFFIRS